MNYTTTDATPTVIGGVKIGANQAGVITATVVGYDAVNKAAVTGKKIARYINVDGTITLGSATSELAVAADSAITGATFAFAAGTNAINVQVTGVASHTIKWKAVVINISLS